MSVVANPVCRSEGRRATAPTPTASAAAAGSAGPSMVEVLLYDDDGNCDVALVEAEKDGEVQQPPAPGLPEDVDPMPVKLLVSCFQVF